MPRWDASLLDQIRERCDIVEIISEYVPLKRAGSNYKGLSPFKKEKTPSFYVTPSKQIWYCFSTSQGGDVYKFLQNYLGLDFPSAVRMLAARAGVELPESGEAYDSDSSETGEKHLKEQLLLLHERLTAHWHNLLMRSPQAETARNYLKSRGITSDVAREFRLGFAPPGWDNTRNWALNEGFDDLLLISSGLVVEKENTSPDHAYDRFRNRIIIPVTSESGQVVAFSGRTLEKGDTREAKYINSPETPIFEKSRILFGLEMHRRALLDARQAIIVEGPFDLIACHTADIKNVVAPQGTALTERHVRTLKRYVDEILLCYDADEAGRLATIRATTQCIAQGLPVRVLALTSSDGTKEDPDTYIRSQGADRFKSLASSAPDFWKYYFQTLSTKHETNTERGRYAFRREVFDIAMHLSDAAELDRVLQGLSGWIGTDTRILQSELRDWKKKNRTSRIDDEKTSLSDSEEREKLPPPHPIISELLSAALHHPDENIPQLQSDLPRHWLQGLPGESILIDLIDTYGTDAWEGSANYISSLQEEQQVVLYKIFAEEKNTPPLEHILIHLKRNYLQNQLKHTENQLRLGQLPPEKALTLLLDIKKELHNLRHPTEN